MCLTVQQHARSPPSGPELEANIINLSQQVLIILVMVYEAARAAGCYRRIELFPPRGKAENRRTVIDDCFVVLVFEFFTNPPEQKLSTGDPL
jgi:hypothetical protein